MILGWSREVLEDKISRKIFLTWSKIMKTSNLGQSCQKWLFVTFANVIRKVSNKKDCKLQKISRNVYKTSFWKKILIVFVVIDFEICAVIRFFLELLYKIFWTKSWLFLKTCFLKTVLFDVPKAVVRSV